MAIGVFDSGIGGLSVHRELVARLPDADFVYFADQAMTPYGGRPGEEIVALTRAGCERLFAQGCDLIILACNTAAAVALRRLQQTWLPEYRRRIGRAVNVLGIIVPTIEAATGLPWEHEAAHKDEKIEGLEVLGIFCTPATAASRVYEIEIDKRRQDVAVFCEACPHLAGAIEADATQADLARAINHHAASLTRRIGRPPDRAILGCTHYEITADLFRAALPPDTPLIHQPGATAAAVELYLRRHREYDPGHGAGRRFLTTGAGGRQNGLAERFWGAALTFEAV